METNEQLEVIPIINKDIICVTCLSRGRKLYNVKDFNVKSYCKDLQLSHKDKVCWECKSIMLKFLMFTKKALKAQSLLAQWNKDTKNSPLPVLSNLTTLSLHNLTCIEEYEVGIENNIIIKSEPDDVDLNIDTEIPDNEQYLDENPSESIKHEEIDIESKITVETDIDNLKETIQMPDKTPPVKQSQTKELCPEVYSNPTVLTPLLLKNEASLSQIMNQDALPTRTESTPKVLKTIKLLKIKRLTREEMMLVGYKMIAEKSKTARMKSLDTTNKCLQEPSDHVCGVCNERFGEESLLRLHEKMHKRVFKCSNCSDEFVSEVLAQRHYERCIMKRHKLYKCNKCVMQFTARNDYRRHKYNAHATDVVCDHCGKHFNNKFNLARHILIHSGNIPTFECKICNKKCRQTGLYQHMKTHNYKIDKAAYCAECDVQFRNMRNYKNHLKDSRNHIKEQDLKFPCPHCEKTFNRISLLKPHIESMHCIERNYHCNECEQSFKTHRGLRAHSRRVHEVHVPAKNYTCTVCGHKFQSRTILNQHMNSHTGKRPFACETCGATFGFFSSLYNHKKKHKGCRALLQQQKKKPETNCESDVEQTDS